MTDFDYENKQKKDIARGARYKKNGSKSRRCTFPSDHLTPAQKAALNGPVTTILLNQPMSWETFRSPAMTDTLRVEYIKNLQGTYRASNQMLSKMFGISASSVGIELRRLNLRPLKGTQGSTPEKTRILHAWDAFCNGVVGGGNDPNLVKPEANEQIEPTDDKVDQPQVTCYDVDAEALANALEEAKRISEMEKRRLKLKRPPQSPKWKKRLSKRTEEDGIWTLLTTLTPTGSRKRRTRQSRPQTLLVS